jgi:hypothetical protein
MYRAISAVVRRGAAGLALVAAGCGGMAVGPDGAVPMGNPGTGPGGGHNVNCGGASFPANATIYQDISGAALDVESASIISALDASGYADSGSQQNLGIDVSFELNCADSGVTRRDFVRDSGYPNDCDTSPVPVPDGGRIEGSTNYECSGDCHLLVYQTGRLYELYQANITGGLAVGGTFTGGCLAVWELGHDYWDPSQQSPNYSRGDHCDGGNAADLPIAPLLLTEQELEDAVAHDGIIHHALRFTIKNNRIRSDSYVHPATHMGFGSNTGGPRTMPYGTRLRLRGDYNLATLSSDKSRVVARTLQHYGMYLADGGNIFISATTDVTGANVSALRPRDFEMVDGGRRIGWHDYSCGHVPITN